MRGIEQIPWLYDFGMLFMDRLGGLNRWRRWLVQGTKGRVLEVGCGTGRNLPLYPEGTTVVGLDPVLDSVRAAKRRAPHALLVVGSAQALPFRDRAFDSAVSSLVFCSVPDPAQGLAEVKRVLAPGAELRMMEHVRSESHVGGRVQDFVQPAWTAILGGCHPNRRTEDNVQAAGFVIEQRKAQGTMRRFVARAR